MIHYFVRRRCLPLPLEEKESLLKYNLFSSVKRDPLQGNNMGFYFWAIGNERPRTLFMSVNNACKLIDSVDIDFKELKDELKLVPHTHFRLDHMLFLYEKHHLANRKDVTLMVVKYLSWLEMFDNYYRMSRFRVFLFVLNALFNAGVTDRTLWRKLFLFAKNDVDLRYEIYLIDPDRFKYFLRHICSKYENNEAFINKFDFEILILKGLIEHLKILLEYKYGYSLEPSVIFLPIYLFGEYIRKIDGLPKDYPPQRLKLLILTIKVMWSTTVEYVKRKEEMVQALKLYWKTVPQAYITLEEMNDILRRLMNNCDFSAYTRQDFENKIQEGCQVYQNTFNVLVHEPRSLQNYTRIVIRKYYTAGTIDELVYPSDLKSYIKLK